MYLNDVNKDEQPRGFFLTLVPHNANYQISNIPKIFLQLVLILRVSPTISMSSPLTTELGSNKSVTLANSITYIFVQAGHKIELKAQGSTFCVNRSYNRDNGHFL